MINLDAKVALLTQSLSVGSENKETPLTISLRIAFNSNSRKTYVKLESNLNLLSFSPSLPLPFAKCFRLPSNHNWQSVADRISELEKQQQKQQQAMHDHNKQHYTYLDPSKTHRVPNPTLKAFQKNAIQSYFERQQQQQQSIRVSKNHHRGGGGNKSDDSTKTKSIGGSEAVMSSNGNVAPRPQSLNLGLATSSVSLPATPSTAISSSSTSSAGSQRSSISSWPSASPTTNQSIMIGSKAPDAAMMKNANDIAKMNMKNSAMSTAVALSEKQSFAANNKGNNGKIQSISKNLYTSFCEIKTENYSREGIAADSNGANKMNATPPPLPRKSNVLRRYLFAQLEASQYLCNYLDIVILTTSTGIIFHLDRESATALINKKSNNPRRRKSAWPWMHGVERSDCLMLIYPRRSRHDTIWILFITPPDTLASRPTGLPWIKTLALQRGIELVIDLLRYLRLFVDLSSPFNKIWFRFHACVTIALHHLLVSF